jgi:hypothetical protein
MEGYCAEKGIKGGDMKKLHKPFKDAMLDEYRSSAKIRERVDRAVYDSAVEFFRALKAEKKGEDVRALIEAVNRDGDSGRDRKAGAAASASDDGGTVD